MPQVRFRNPYCALYTYFTVGVVRNPVTQPSSDTYAFFEGVQYVGDITIKNDPSCDQLVSIHGGLQFVNASEVNGRPGFVGVSLNNNGRKSSLTDYNIGCVGQNYYIADGPKLKYFVQPSEEPSVQYVNCTMVSRHALCYTCVNSLFPVGRALIKSRASLSQT